MKNAALIICLLAVMSGMSYTPACAQGTVLVGISTPTADHGWTGGIVWWAGRAVEEFNKKYPAIRLTHHASATDKEQAAAIDAMLEQGVKALVILPHKPATLTSILNKAHKAGVYVVVVDRSIPKVPKDVYLAGDNKGFGRKNGEYLAQALGGKGAVLVMEGIPCEGNTLRVTGFKEGIAKHPGIVVLDSQPAYWSPPKGYELMQRYLQQFSAIDAVWCGDDDVLESVLQAYAESGRTDVKLFLGGGGSKAVIKRILDEDPLVPVTVTYPPKMIYEGVAIAVEHLAAGKKSAKEIVIPSELVTRRNAVDFYYPDSIY